MRKLKSIFLFLLVFGLAGAAQATTAKQTISKTFPASHIKKIQLKTGSGDIQLASWDKNEIQVKATKNARGDDEKEARKLLEKIRLRMQVKGDQLWLEAKNNKSGFSFSGHRRWVDFVVTAPRKMNLDLRSGSGDIRADNFAGKVRAKTGSGDIRSSKIKGDLWLNSGSGDIQVAEVQGSLDSKSGSGSFDGKQITGAIKTKTGSGEIEIRQISPSNLLAGSGSGDVELLLQKIDSLEEIRVSTGSGDIEIRTPALANANIVASSGSGKYRCDFCQEVKKLNQSGPKNINEKLGSGKVKVSLKSGSGDIELRQN